MRWTGSDRRQRLPNDWAKRIVPAVLRRDPICCICHQVPASEVDHVEPGDNHEPDNLQGLCGPCHATKSSAEGVAAQRRRKRPPEPHPGVT